ncbi:MAG: hypothetical protein HZA70_02345 [Planctomycetes bacterium]|nr:hypothetical protein [Planctomycetota bacterium]
MNKTSKVFGNLVRCLGLLVLVVGFLFAFSNLSLAQRGIGWPALPDAGEPPALKPSPSPSDTPKKVVEAPASPVVTTTPSVVTPTPSPSEDKGKKDDEVAKKDDDDDKKAKKGDDDDDKGKKAKKGDDDSKKSKKS